jgi:sugar phosphate isomerase/epimerase
MMDRLAIEFICVFGMPPVKFIELAAKLNCPRIGLAPAPIVTLPGLYEAWDLRSDPTLRRETANALRDNGVTITQAEGFLIMPGIPPERLASDMDLMAELGAKQLNAVCLEAEFAANVDGYGRFADLADDRGLTVTVEFLPGMTIGNLATADALVQQVGQDNAGILIDAMHLYRSGSTSADLAAIEPARIRYAQLCDVPLVPVMAEYADEARFERRAPGDGDLPLADFINALPGDVTIGLEVPQRSLVEQGTSAEERLASALAKARTLLVKAN